MNIKITCAECHRHIGTFVKLGKRQDIEIEIHACHHKARRIKDLEAENEQLKKWQIKPSEAICLTDLACRHKKVFKND